jgi:hypothetical protein
MSIGVGGNYILRMKFGSSDVPLSPTAFKDFSIIQDYNRLLPYFQLQVADPSGTFTHVLPVDKEMTRVSVEIGTIGATTVVNNFSFVVYRRFPEMVNMAATNYEVQGLLNVPNLFYPTWCRAAYGTVYNTLASIATQELVTDLVDISPRLNIVKNILQPKWSNAELFRYLKRMLGDDGGYAYLPYFYVQDSNVVFAFKSLEDMTLQDPSYKFIINDTPYQDYLPVMDYFIFDNYQALGVKGIVRQDYGYFDWDKGQYVEAVDDYSEYLSLSDYIAWDFQDHQDSDPIYDTGRTNEFTQTFKGRIRGEYYNRLNSMTKMWLHTWGLPNCVPGQVVKVLFAQGLSAGNLATYQYSGYWLVERVVQSFGATFTTKLLLTRAGVDTDQSNSLIAAFRRKV